MSGGTADDGKTADERAKGVDVTPVAAPSASGPARPSEWTASDHRGPLRAPTEGDRTVDEVERFVPSSEVDAEGVRDVPAHEPASIVEPHAADAPVAEAPLGAAARDEAHHEAYQEAPGEATAGATAPPAAPTRGAEPARRSPLPLAFAGLVVGSLIGAGSAALVYDFGTGGSSAASETSTKLTDLATRVDALEKRPDPQGAIGDVRNEVHALSGRVAALEKRPAAAPQPAPSAEPKVAANPPPASAAPAPAPPAAPSANGELVGKVAALQAALDAMGKQDGSRQAAIKDLGGKLDALQGSLAQVQAASRSSADAVKGRQQDVDGKLAALQSAVSGAQKQASAVQGDLSAVQGNLATVQSEQKTLAGKVGAPALAVAADSLVAQVESGKPYRAQVDALATLNADPARIAVLRESAGTGVASAQALAASFAPLADPVIATGTKAPAGAGFGEQLKRGLFGLVDVRRAGDTAGNGLASRVALMQADLAHGDVGGAYAVWSALPADAQARAGGFGAQLKSSAEAVAAARALQTQSIDGLAAAGAPAAKKS